LEFPDFRPIARECRAAGSFAHLVDGVLYAVLFVLLILAAGATNDVYT
jgi:hypothetical protein